MNVRLEIGDCLEVLPRLRREGLLVDSVVTDPPYHLASIVDRLGKPGSAPIQSGATGVYARSSSGFMGQQWDGGDVAFRAETWAIVASVMKPGAHLIAFGGTRTYHRLACAIEDAGFEVRDQIGWLYGTGFPKSHDVSKVLDKAAIDDAHRWAGWGTALKPAWEPIVLARKPSPASVPETVIAYGTGAINIDACRVPVGDPDYARNCAGDRGHADNRNRQMDEFQQTAGSASSIGRWPANVIHDGSEEVLDAFAEYGERGALAPVHRRNCDKFRNTYGMFKGDLDEAGSTFRGDRGTAACFFYSAKAAADDRAGSKHPTVKPIALMTYLCRMVTPPGGLILDPFAGSGTTGAAARREGFQALLIEREAEYAEDIARRLGLTLDEMQRAKVAAHAAEKSALGPLFQESTP